MRFSESNIKIWFSRGYENKASEVIKVDGILNPTLLSFSNFEFIISIVTASKRSNSISLEFAS